MTLLHRLELGLSISFFISVIPQLRPLCFPLQIFTTWVHECSHALNAALLGGSAIKISLAKDGSGLTQYKIAPGKLNRSIIASSGYLGASFFGCLLFALVILGERGSKFFSPRHLVLGLCTGMALSLLFFIRNGFGGMSVLILAGAFASLLFPPMSRFASELILFLAIQTALNALFDIRNLFSVGKKRGTQSDAHTLQSLFYLPAWFWAGLWLMMSAGMMGFTLCWLKLCP